MTIPWQGGPVVVFDTETTGCGAGDRVVSLGAVRLDAALEPEATLHLAFAPGIPCHWGAAPPCCTDRLVGAEGWAR
jgi:DNA polymerase-3 subunit epsilon